MTTQLHNTGEEFIIRHMHTEDLAKPDSVEVTLFNDATSGLSDSSDVNDIQDEPTGSGYSRQTAAFGTTDFQAESNASDNWQAVIADQTYDTEDSTVDVDAYAVIINFESIDASDNDASNHLYFTGDLDQSYDLSGIDQFTLSGAGIAIT